MNPLQLSPDSALLVVDVQDRLLSAMPEDAVPDFLKYLRILVRLAEETGTTVLYTEQYPEGLGSTEETVADALQQAGASRVLKTRFDACAARRADGEFEELPEQVVVAGTETHICVWLTVQTLVERGHRVIVPFDAVLSRRERYKENGLELIRQSGASIANVESLIFASLGDSDHEAFKEFSRLIR